ncbi:MAG TPA: hypothetical protein V6C81_13930 [Planktothrix sp.]|jgi:hypothetical protein
MHKLKPLSITVQDENTYIVRFLAENGEVEFAFKVEEQFVSESEDPLLAIAWDGQYSKMVGGDPAAQVLNKAICELHEARNFRYGKTGEKK